MSRSGLNRGNAKAGDRFIDGENVAENRIETEQRRGVLSSLVAAHPSLIMATLKFGIIASRAELSQQTLVAVPANGSVSTP